MKQDMMAAVEMLQACGLHVYGLSDSNIRGGKKVEPIIGSTPYLEDASSIASIEKPFQLTCSMPTWRAEICKGQVDVVIRLSEDVKVVAQSICAYFTSDRPDIRFDLLWKLQRLGLIAELIDGDHIQVDVPVEAIDLYFYQMMLQAEQLRTKAWPRYHIHKKNAHWLISLETSDASESWQCDTHHDILKFFAEKLMK
jgi:hypothetical protein